MKTPKTTATTDGLEWLRGIRADIQKEIGATPMERAAYYRQREKTLSARIYQPPGQSLHEEESKFILREQPPAS